MRQSVHVVDGGLGALAEHPNCYDTICCLNVLDHVDDVSSAVRLLRDAVRPGGRIVLSAPHSLKDRGGWRKAPRADGWDYLYFVLDGYFDEGRCKKVREDRFGNVRVRNVETYHRTVSRYLNEVLGAGLTISRVEEPAPDERYAHDEPVIYSKASKILYFLIIVAERRHE